MVKVEDIETMGWRKAIKGMRNPLNSWDKSDSEKCYILNEITKDNINYRCAGCKNEFSGRPNCYILGPNDLDLALRLIKAGPEHRKFLRMIHVQMDITGPLYWWKEMDTYKVATVANSCSTMHKIHSKRFEESDFSVEHIKNFNEQHWKVCLDNIIASLNVAREKYLETKDKTYWWQLIQLLPSSYNQLRTWDSNMETILSILHQRAHHKLNTDWEPFRQACFDNIPYCKEFYEAMYGKEEN